MGYPGIGLKVKSIGGKIPCWTSLGDAGLDLHSSEDFSLSPGELRFVPLGIQTSFSVQYVGIIKERSGLAGRGISIQAGVIDSSYRGEWKVLMLNRGGGVEGTWDVKKGDRVAQVIFLPCFHLLIEEVNSLSDSKRGVKGFGSSGR